MALREGPQNAPREFAFVDWRAPALRAIAADEPVDQRIIDFAHNEMAGIAVKAVGKGTQLPVAEVCGKEKHAAALALGALIVFIPIVNNQAFNIVAIPAGKWE